MKVLEQGIDTDTPEGRAMFGMLAVMAELNREPILANTRDGLAAARARGRKPKLTDDQAKKAQRLYDDDHAARRDGLHTCAIVSG